MSKVSQKTAARLTLALEAYEEEAEMEYIAMPLEMYKTEMTMLREAEENRHAEAVKDFERITGTKF